MELSYSQGHALVVANPPRICRKRSFTDSNVMVAAEAGAMIGEVNVRVMARGGGHDWRGQG